MMHDRPNTDFEKNLIFASQYRRSKYSYNGGQFDHLLDAMGVENVFPQETRFVIKPKPDYLSNAGDLSIRNSNKRCDSKYFPIFGDIKFRISDVPAVFNMLKPFIDKHFWNTYNLFESHTCASKRAAVQKEFQEIFPYRSQKFKVKVIVFCSNHQSFFHSCKKDERDIKINAIHNVSVYIAQQTNNTEYGWFDDYCGSGVALKEIPDHFRRVQELTFFCNSKEEINQLEAELIWAFKCLQHTLKKQEIFRDFGKFVYDQDRKKLCSTDAEYYDFMVEVSHELNITVLNRGKGKEGRIIDTVRYRATKYYVYTDIETKQVQIHTTPVFCGEELKKYNCKVMFPESTNDMAEFKNLKEMFLKGYLKITEPSAAILTKFF